MSQLAFVSGWDTEICGFIIIIIKISADVLDMLDKMIKAVDEELLEEALMSIGEAVLPHIQHWDRLVTMLRDQALAVVTVLPAILGVSAAAILAVIVLTPIYLSVRVYKCVSELFFLFREYGDTDVDGLSSRFFGRLLSIHRTLDDLREGLDRRDAEAARAERGIETDWVVRDGEGAPGGHDGGPSGEQGGGSPLGVGIMYTQDVPRITNTTSQE